MKKMTRGEKIDNTVTVLLLDFEITMCISYEEEPDYFGEENPTLVLDFDDEDDKYDYIMISQFWHREWSIYLVSRITDFIYIDPATIEFGLN